MKKFFRQIYLRFGFGALLSSVGAVSHAQAPKTDDCVAPQTQQSQTEHDDRRQDPDTAGTSSNDLADCGGVIKPPASGDKDFVQPAPPTGDRPVISPNDVSPSEPKAK
jgi:hypothetical protein